MGASGAGELSRLVDARYCSLLTRTKYRQDNAVGILDFASSLTALLIECPWAD